MRVFLVNVGVPREVSWANIAGYVNGAVIPVDGAHIAAAGVHQSLAKERA